MNKLINWLFPKNNLPDKNEDFKAKNEDFKAKNEDFKAKYEDLVAQNEKLLNDNKFLTKFNNTIERELCWSKNELMALEMCKNPVNTSFQIDESNIYLTIINSKRVFIKEIKYPSEKHYGFFRYEWEIIVDVDAVRLLNEKIFKNNKYRSWAREMRNSQIKEIKKIKGIEGE